MTHPSHCHLLVARLPAPEASIGTLPALRRLLSRGRLQQIPLAAEHALCQVFGLNPPQQDWPLAPLALLGEGVDPGASVWMRVGPVHYQLQRDSFSLDLPQPPLAPEDAGQLVADLNRHFEGRGMVFTAPHPQRWYLRLAQAPALRTYPLSQALGRDVGRCAPEGEDAAAWRSIVNEAQMLLHDHPVNRRREAAGQLSVNSLWPEGAGVLPETLGRRFERVWSDLVLVRGLARLSGSDCRPVVEVFQQPSGSGDDLLVLAPTAWEPLEAEMLQPMLEGLRTGRWASLTLDFGGREGVLRCQIRRQDLWKFWRRPVSLEGCFG